MAATTRSLPGWHVRSPRNEHERPASLTASASGVHGMDNYSGWCRGACGLQLLGGSGPALGGHLHGIGERAAGRCVDGGSGGVPARRRRAGRPVRYEGVPAPRGCPARWSSDQNRRARASPLLTPDPTRQCPGAWPLLQTHRTPPPRCPPTPSRPPLVALPQPQHPRDRPHLRGALEQSVSVVVCCLVECGEVGVDVLGSGTLSLVYRARASCQ